jgi:CheY-like chemotaxis protein
MSRLHILLVEDDQENLRLLKELLPTTINGEELIWHDCDSFDKAYDQLQRQRYDLVVTDIYRDREGANKHQMSADDAKGTSMLDIIRKVRFCPIVFFSDGSLPENIHIGPFVRFVDKVKTEQLVNEINAIVATSIPTLAAKLHEELDRAAGSYLWTFLEEEWNRLTPTHTTPEVLERLIRRRASVQLGHLNPAATTPTELAVVEGAEFYLYPCISGDEYRLGDILRGTNDFRVVLTPHCYLITQPGDEGPRADHVVTVKTVLATELIGKYPFKGNEDDKRKRLVRCLNSPAQIGLPSGRHWFLPKFLAIPDLYCDFLQLESMPLGTVRAQYERIATLASPFSEALQMCYLRFYTTVGLPNLHPERFEYLASLVPPQPLAGAAAALQPAAPPQPFATAQPVVSPNSVAPPPPAAAVVEVRQEMPLPPATPEPAAISQPAPAPEAPPEASLPQPTSTPTTGPATRGNGTVL